jgi:putative ATP-dependent endonuclease of OLD family
MQLFKLTIKGFRCFSSESTTTVEFDPLTVFVGANGAGKSAALMALVRMFGAANVQRTLTREDFFIPPTPRTAASAGGPPIPSTVESAPVASATHAAPNLVGLFDAQSFSSAMPAKKLEMRIEAWFKFPELMDDAAAATSSAVPECIRNIFVTESTQNPPICRIRLDGTWSPGPTAEGDIDQKLLWVKSDAAEVTDDKTHPLLSPERRLIQALYVPATRDAVRELRAVSGTLLSRVLKHIRWPDALKTKVVELDRELTSAVLAEATLGELEATLRTHWSELAGTGSSPSLTFVNADLAGILGRLDAEVKGPVGTRPIELLSEGERSLLYFALVESTLKLEASLAEKGLLLSDGAPRPVLTILAVEEPENHLAPQYLGRIVKAVRISSARETFKRYSRVTRRPLCVASSP